MRAGGAWRGGGRGGTGGGTWGAAVILKISNDHVILLFEGDMSWDVWVVDRD